MRSPLVPVTATVYVPGRVVADAEIVSVEVAETVTADNTTLFGLETALSPVEVADSVMVPLNPFRPLRLIVEVPEEPARIDTEGGLAEIVKSTTVTVTSNEWEIVPLVAVTLRVYVPYREAETVVTAGAVPPATRLTV